MIPAEYESAKAMAEDEVKFWIRHGCEVCGTGAPTYRNTITTGGLKTCRGCFDNNIDVPRFFMKYILSKVNDDEYAFIYLIRLYFRLMRQKGGVIDPQIICWRCGKRKSVFEFPTEYQQNWNEPSGLVCYACIQSLSCKQCISCDEWFYGSRNPELCYKCTVKYGTFDGFLRELKSNYYSNAQCKATLRRRGLPDDIPELIEFERQRVLMKRTQRKLIKWRQDHEQSNSQNV